MSGLLIPYILALLLYQEITSLSQMPRFLGTLSHGRLTDLLYSDWNGQILLNSFTISLLNHMGGYLILDDTVIPEPCSK
ncbi:MAG: hypothetical protein IEMM0008_1002 [bacterium]|nr:MAG: hypothetical protein IEMM0008_1002 [bacterium]